LSRLLRETGDPFYKHCLDIRAVQKIRGTYVIGTEKRLDSEDRVHPETTFKPSTMRTSQVNPNLQNVTADKGGKDSIAAGFRKVVVARGRFVEEGSEYADQ
jgi:DNA polymerase I-like protein with 3'-5' exonuclease and polymerase domains